MRIVEYSSELQEKAIQLFLERVDKSWSLVDCVSFVVMHDLSLWDALTTDRHFEQAGFTALLK